MISSIKDPIRKKVILLVLLSLTSLMLLTFSHQFGFKIYERNLEKEINNQISKKEIGELISKNINESHLKITHLLKSSNPLSYDIYKQENKKICNQIYELLSILQNGGEYNYKYNLNLAKLDLSNIIISYKKPTNEGIVLEAINLFPKIKMIEDSFNEILDIKEKILNLKFASEKKDLNNEAIYKEMMLHTVYERALEDINRITFEVEQKIFQMKNYRKKLRVANTHFFLLLLSIFSIIISIVSLVLNKQIKMIQKENEENTERFKAFSEATFEGLIFSENGKIFDMNKKVTDLTGYSLKEIQGFNKTNFIDSKYKKRIMLNINSNSDKPYDVVGKRKDGKRIAIEFKGKSFHYKNRIIRVASIKDITDRKKAEEELKASKDRLSKTLMVANDGMWDWDLITNKVYFDPRYYEMAGYAVDEFPHEFDEFKKRVHPKDVKNVMVQAQLYLEGKTARFNVEFRFKKKGGGWLWINGRGLIVERDKNNKPLRFIGTHSDITDRKKAEEVLRKSEEKYRVMIENSGDAILIRQNGAFVFANKSLLTKLGYSKEEFFKLGNNIIFQQEILTEMDSRFLQNETYQISFETKILNKNETTIDVEVTERVIFYDDTKAQFLTIRDITKQKEIMKILQRGAEQTKGLNEFIPICAGCSLIRDDEKEGKPWVKPAEYISERLPEVKFSHGMCPDCMKKWYPDFVEDKEG